MVHGEPTWAPSDLFALASERVEAAVDGPVHVRGRVTDTGASRGGTQFVTLVDEGATTVRWDTPRLGLVVFSRLARWLERPLGGPVHRALAPGTVVDAVGRLGLAPGDGAVQLRVSSLAVAADSTDAAAVAALRARIEREDWAAERPPLPPVLRRVGALISVAGDGDLDEALRLLAHDAAAPAFCRHRIHPLSATARHDVPALVDHHVRAGADAVLIAFGGHLPAVSAWDSVEVLEAIRRAHRAGVPVVAGFAHGRDQPLTKLVAHNHAQASAAVAALVHHNRGLLGRLAPGLVAVADQVEGAAARASVDVGASLRRAAATTEEVAQGVHRRLTAEVGRAALVPDRVRAGDALPTRLTAAVEAIGDPRTALQQRVVASATGLLDVQSRVERDLATAHDTAARLPRLFGRGFAVVTDVGGTPLPDDGPRPGDRVRVVTASTRFTATVDDVAADDAAAAAGSPAPAQHDQTNDPGASDVEP